MTRDARIYDGRGEIDTDLNHWRNLAKEASRSAAIRFPLPASLMREIEEAEGDGDGE